MTTLEFDGIPFDPVTALAADPRGSVDGSPSRRPDPGGAGTRAGSLAPSSDDAPIGSAADGLAVSGTQPGASAAQHMDSAAAHAAGPLAEIRSGVVAAHRAALTAQLAMQRAVWQRALRRSAGPGEAKAASGPGFGGHADEGVDPGTARALFSVRGGFTAAESAFKPLARTGRTRLDRAALLRLTEGDLSGVFGAAHRRSGIEAVVRLAGTAELALTEVTAIELYGGAGNGRVEARFEGDPRAAATQTAEVFALYLGLPLVLSGSSLVAECAGTVAGGASGSITLTVTALDLVPRPHICGTATIAGAEGALDVTVTVVERPGSGVGPGEVSEGLLLNEFHMTHLSRGDQGIAMGPEFAQYTGVRATRLPTGGLLLVDRVLDFDGRRGNLDGASYTTEYDSPADSWYYGDTANDSMPHFVYMETSLQAALLMGYYAGPTLTQPGTTLSLRNLGGTATVLRQIDLRDKTIRQSSRLLSTTILPGSSLQTFDYTLSVDGEPFYAGETMFGYFSDEALGNQTGLDAGRPAPSWLAENPGADVRTIDVAARRADPRARLCARRTLALIDRVDVVDGGGRYDAGYLHSLREIDPSDWYFARHFHLDPVIPGSLGVESVIHAIQEWMLDAGLADTIGDPVFRIPAGRPFSWRYRGQFLPTDGTVELEAHIKEIQHGPRGVTVVADGSLWKPGLRIYELTDLAVELAEREER
ncbi:beta-hydroxydecanoyl-ACP dehydratase [Nocardia abscessus]|uniref:Beta-hydroxydecanoyl-ACP dehydratase n=1 Tax=Nocardia abscessus TaxID=120957 RepID=A0ABS0CGS4_9NOCA|nr:beta-hydroxydecanoyl-ACP dehydratase [Nocardia abscessus]MBF6229542.1 beta-hydroxydecanoyl-ACP dehydratase [Nocardia abscessus]